MKKCAFLLLNIFLTFTASPTISSFFEEENLITMTSLPTIQDLSNEVINRVSFYLSAEGGQPALLTDTRFHDNIHYHNQKEILKSFSKDLHPALLKNKTSEEIYQIYLNKVKESVSDTYAIPESFEGLYSTPHLDPSSPVAFYSLNLVSDIYRIYPKIFNFMVSRGNTDAIQIHEFEIQGNKDFFEITPTLEELIARNNCHAAQRKLEILSDFNRIDYDPARLKAYIEERSVDKTCPWIETKFEALMKGDLGYDQNPTAAMTFLDACVAQKNLTAKNLKIEILLKNENNPYEFQPDLAYQLNEELLAQGDTIAYARKMRGLIQGNELYSRDIPAARCLIIQQKEKDNTHVFNHFLQHLSLVRIKNSKDFVFIHQFIDELIVLGNETSLKTKYKGLFYAESGYNWEIATEKRIISDLENQGLISEEEAKIRYQVLKEQAMLTANQFLLEQQALGNSHAFELQYNNSSTFEHRDSLFMRENKLNLQRFIENQINQGDLCYINYRLRELLDGLSRDGYTQKHLLVKQFIDKLHNQGNRYGSYLKALGLKFGAFGFNMDDNNNPINEEIRRQQACDFIIKNRIAF